MKCLDLLCLVVVFGFIVCLGVGFFVVFFLLLVCFCCCCLVCFAVGFFFFNTHIVHFSTHKAGYFPRTSDVLQTTHSNKVRC